MKTLAVRNFISIISIFLSFYVNQFCIFECKFTCNRIIITSDDVCCNIQNVKFIKVMQFKQIFATAVCVLSLLKQKWPKSKNFYQNKSVIYCFKMVAPRALIFRPLVNGNKLKLWERDCYFLCYFKMVAQRVCPFPTTHQGERRLWERD